MTRGSTRRQGVRGLFVTCQVHFVPLEEGEKDRSIIEDAGLQGFDITPAS